jgi:hypothetical protein
MPAGRFEIISNTTAEMGSLASAFLPNMKDINF